MLYYKEYMNKYTFLIDSSNKTCACPRFQTKQGYRAIYTTVLTANHRTNKSTNLLHRSGSYCNAYFVTHEFTQCIN